MWMGTWSWVLKLRKQVQRMPRTIGGEGGVSKSFTRETKGEDEREPKGTRNLERKAGQ